MPIDPMLSAKCDCERPEYYTATALAPVETINQIDLLYLIRTLSQDLYDLELGSLSHNEPLKTLSQNYRSNLQAIIKQAKSLAGIS